MGEMMTKLQNSAVFSCQPLLNYQTNKTGVACFPWSSAHYKSSFMPAQLGSVNVEAGVVAGQQEGPSPALPSLLPTC